MYTTRKKYREILTQRGGAGGGRYKQMYTTRTIDRERETQIQRRKRQVQIDVYNIEQQLERCLDREEAEEVQIDVYNIEQQIERWKHRQREGGGGWMYTTRKIDREILTQRGGGNYIQMYTTQNNRQRDTQIKRSRRRQVQIDLYNQNNRQRERVKQIERRRKR